jgi:putative transposase
MPRIARVAIPGLPHHVTQRGNFQQEVFPAEEYCTRYIEWLTLYATRFGTRFWAWCLMTNHVHFVCVPERDDSLARTFHHAHQRYALYLNKRLGRRGHLWQGRFYSCPLDEAHTYLAVRYVERNPVRAGLAQLAEDYPWSSARAHVSGSPDPLLERGNPFERSVEDWKTYLSRSEPAQLQTALRRATFTGRPLGSSKFVRQLESALGRRLHPLAHGRPMKGVARV